MDIIDEQKLFEDEFTSDLLDAACKVFMELYGEWYPIDVKEFENRCKTNLHYIADDLCYDYNEMFFYYKKNTEPYISYDYKVVKPKNGMTQEEIDEWRALYPKIPDQDAKEIIEERIEEYKNDYDIEMKFHGCIKKFITPYIEDCTHFPACAYREIEYLTWICYADFQSEMVQTAEDILKEMNLPEEEEEEIIVT